MATLLGHKNKSTSGSRELFSSALIGTRKKFTDTYLVKAVSTNENEDDIMSAPGIPFLRSLSRNAFCYKKSAREIDASALLWEVDVEFDSHVDAQQRVATVSWENEEIQEVIEMDQITGVPIRNSVGEPLIIEAPYTIPILVIKRVEETFNPAVILLYSNRVNSLPFWGAPPYCALMQGPTAEPINMDGGQKFSVTYRIKFNLKIDPDTLLPKGWFARPLNQGTRFWDDTKEDYTNFSVDEQDPTTGNLSLAGAPLGPTDDPVYLTYNKYRLANFNILGLGPF